MHHSHESLDRAGGLRRAGLLTPLHDRDFRLLWAGMCLSLIGDGAFLVALSWHVLALSGGPVGMTYVGIAMTVPMIVFLLIGGGASGPLPRRLTLPVGRLPPAPARAAMGGPALRGRGAGSPPLLPLAPVGSG